MPWRRALKPTLLFLQGESQDRGAWQAAVHGVAESQADRSDLAHMHGGNGTFTELSLITQLVKNLPVMQETGL